MLLGHNAQQQQVKGTVYFSSQTGEVSVHGGGPKAGDRQGEQALHGHAGSKPPFLFLFHPGYEPIGWCTHAQAGSPHHPHLELG